jgi:RNA polymerase sigma-70 factor, ECF subfamily
MKADLRHSPRPDALTHKIEGRLPFTTRGTQFGVPVRVGRLMRAAVALEPSTAKSVAPSVIALGDLMREHTPYVWRVLRSLGVRESDLEDVCQETFIVVHRRLPSFEGRGSLRSWIYGIALRMASDYRGKAHRRREVLTLEQPQPIVPAPQEAVIDRKRAWLLIDSLLDRLSEEQRQVFVLYELEELSMREVREIIDCPLQTAYSRLHAARKIVQSGLWHPRAGGVR